MTLGWKGLSKANKTKKDIGKFHYIKLQTSGCQKQSHSPTKKERQRKKGKMHTIYYVIVNY